MIGWICYALLGPKAGLSLRGIYARYLESPGTKAYSVAEGSDSAAVAGAGLFMLIEAKK